MSIRYGLYFIAGASILGSMIPMPVYAKSSDRSVPANADGTKFSGNIGPDTKSQLDGDVVITQGSLRITGSHADLYTDHANQLVRAVVTGDRAHVEQLDDANLRMTADARTIDYSVDSGIAILTGAARASKEAGGAVSGDVVRYNVGAGTFDASSTGATLVHVTFSAKGSPPAKPGN